MNNAHVQGNMEQVQDDAASHLYRVVRDAEEALSSLRKFFTAADADGSGCLDRKELADVIKLFYRQENVSRNIEVVQREVDKALSRFDANGDGVLQFDEFVDMFALSESFRFSMSIAMRLEVRTKCKQQLTERHNQVVEDATRVERLRNWHLQTTVESLTVRLDEKVTQVWALQGELVDTQGQHEATSNRLQDALDEVDLLQHELQEGHK